MRTTSDVFTLVSASTLLPWKTSYRKCLCWVRGRTRTTQKEMRKEQEEGICHLLTTGKQCKHLITAVPGTWTCPKDPALSVLNCGADGCWPVMHDTAHGLAAPACAHCCQPSLQVMNTVLRPCKRGLGQSWWGWGLGPGEGWSNRGHKWLNASQLHS